MLLSIVMPIYNAAFYLDRGISAILQSNSAEFELILIDDGSSDDSSNVCRKYSMNDTRVRFFQQNNKGLCVTRNTGIDFARGKYIWFIDADDIIAEENFDCLIEYLQHVDVDSVYCNYYRLTNNCLDWRSYYDIDIKRINDRDSIEKIDYLWGEKKITWAVWNCVYKRDLLIDNDIYFDVRLAHYEDGDFNLRVIQNAKTSSFFEKPIYIYRTDNLDSLSHKRKSADHFRWAHFFCLKWMMKFSNSGDKGKHIYNRLRESYSDLLSFIRRMDAADRRPALKLFKDRMDVFEMRTKEGSFESKKVLFILPPFERLMGYYRYYTHQGLLMLAASAEEDGHKALVYDSDYCPHGNSFDHIELMNAYSKYVKEMELFESPIWDEIKKVIEDFDPDFIGISVLSVTQASARKVAHISKSIKPTAQIIVGGPHATLLPDSLLDYADYIVRNEGEHVIKHILDGSAKKGIIDGLRITEIDKLPFPAIHLLYNQDLYTKKDLSMVISSRGCNYNCKFCASPELWNRKVIHKSVSNFVNELCVMNEKYGINDFFISDDSFSCDKDWLMEFCSAISGLNFTWRCLDRINNVNKDILTFMRNAGCRHIKYGIESGSDRILKRISKGIRVRDIYHADQILNKTGMDWSAYFMIGFPGEKYEDIKATQNMIRSISASSVTISVFTPYPGNTLYNCNDLDFKYYSHHSPYNNFTGTIPNEEFSELVKETCMIAKEISCGHNYFTHN